MEKFYVVMYFILLGTISGCTQPKQLFLEDGTVGYSVNCNGTANDWADCYNKSSRICNNMYHVKSQNSFATEGIPYRNIIIQCK